jgi:hypothetical protein
LGINALSRVSGYLFADLDDRRRTSLTNGGIFCG